MTAPGLPEPRRREYLAALGVPLFAPRAPLTGALPSPVMAMVPADILAAEVMAKPVAALSPTPAGLSAPAVPSAQAAGSRSPMPAATRDLLNRPATAPGQAVTAIPAVAAQPVLVGGAPAVSDLARSAPAAVSADIPRFACRLLRVSEQDFVLLDLGEYPDLGPREAQLWRGIVQALGWRAEGMTADFTWPLTGSGLLGQGADVAREMLAAWLGRDVPAQARLFVFGEAPAAHVQRPHRLMPALAQLLASPQAKRQLWRELVGA